MKLSIITFGSSANENFSVEIEALTLVMEQYEEDAESKEDTESKIELDVNEKTPSYMALRQDAVSYTHLTLPTSVTV